MFLKSEKKEMGKCMILHTVIFAIMLSSSAAWGGNFILPYFPSLSAQSVDSPYWSGITVYNNSNTSGTATFIFYERDGDVGQYTTTIPAWGMFVTALENLAVVKIAGSGTLGDSPLFANISCNFDCGGMGMMANAVTGESFDISSVIDSKSFILPYFPSLSAPSVYSPFWSGITLYNNSNTSGTAVLTFYQIDGVVGQYTTPIIPAKGMYVNTLDGISITKISGSGGLGGLPSFVNVSSDFYGGGFGMMGNVSTGESFSVHAKLKDSRNRALPGVSMLLLGN